MTYQYRIRKITSPTGETFYPEYKRGDSLQYEGHLIRKYSLESALKQIDEWKENHRLREIWYEKEEIIEVP